MRNLFITIIVLGFCFWHYGFNFLATIFILSFLIFFHELGHFLVAKYFKVRILTFSIGFGKPIFVKHYNGTDYQISSIFLGGYVKMKGQDDSDPTLKNYDADSYSVLHPFKKILILFAGPFFNLLLAYLLFVMIAFIGSEKIAPIIGGLNEKADKVLMVNDEILAVNGVKIKSFDEIKPLIKSGENDIKVLRDGKTLDLKANTYSQMGKNVFNEDITSHFLGITSKQGAIIYVSHRDFSAFKIAFNNSYESATLILKGLKKLILAELSPKNISGIISIADITTQAASFGINTLLFITALLSINLGLLNLLPVPVLDGGHIMFNLYELIFRREINQKAYEILSYIGMALLFSLMLYATYNDIARIITGEELLIK